MSIHRVLLVDRWGELAEVLDFINGRLDDIGTEKNITSPAQQAEDDSMQEDDWEEGYLTALNDIVVCIQRLYSKGSA